MQLSLILHLVGINFGGVLLSNYAELSSRVQPAFMPRSKVVLTRAAHVFNSQGKSGLAYSRSTRPPSPDPSVVRHARRIHCAVCFVAM